MKMKLAYVSGKYSDPRGAAFIERNIRQAADIAMQLWSLGVAVICPHTNTAHFDGATDYEGFITGDLVMVDRCDLVVMVPNWKASNGAGIERNRAMKQHVPVFNWPDDACYVVRFCWPEGMPAQFVESSRHFLPEELHERIREGYCWPAIPTPGSIQ